MKMVCKIKFDRPITEAHYIVPGGYTFKFMGEEPIEFDFMESFSEIVGEGDVLLCQLYDLDIGAFPVSHKLLYMNLNHLVSIDEFFVYTGEDDEPEIYPVEILELTFLRGDTEFKVPKSVLGAANLQPVEEEV